MSWVPVGEYQSKNSVAEFAGQNLFACAILINIAKLTSTVLVPIYITTSSTSEACWFATKMLIKLLFFFFANLMREKEESGEGKPWHVCNSICIVFRMRLSIFSLVKSHLCFLYLSFIVLIFLSISRGWLYAMWTNLKDESAIFHLPCLSSLHFLFTLLKCLLHARLLRCLNFTLSHCSTLQDYKGLPLDFLDPLGFHCLHLTFLIHLLFILQNEGCALQAMYRASLCSGHIRIFYVYLALLVDNLWYLSYRSSHLSF